MLISEIGEVIRAVRISQEMRLEDASIACGVSISFLSDIENGKENLRVGLVLHVLDQLGIDLTLSTPTLINESSNKKRVRK